MKSLATQAVSGGALALLLLLLGAADLLAAERLGRRINNNRAGYSVRIVDGFGEIPVPPKSEKLIGRFLGERTYFGQPGFQIYLYPKPVPEKKPKVDPTKKKKYGDEERKKKEEEAKRKAPFKQDTYLKTLNLISLKDVGKGKATKVGKKSSRYYEFTVRDNAYLACSIPTKEGGEFGLLFWAPASKYRKTYRSAFHQSMKSFKRLEVDGQLLADLEELSPKERVRAEKKNLIKGVPGWYSLDTENYVILSNSEDRPMVRYIGKSIERLRKDVYMDLFPPVGSITTLSVVRVCASSAEYHRYGGPPGSAGYWNSAAEELVFYDRFPNMSKKKSRANSLSVLYHEAFHQYIFYAFGELAPHSWFNEGNGDFFAGADFRGSKVSVKPFKWRTGRVKQAATLGKLVPLEKFVRYSQKEYYKNAGQNYAQGWAFIYFLRKVTKNERYRQILPLYFNTLKDEIERIDANKLAVTKSPKTPAPEEKSDSDPPKPDGNGDPPAEPGPEPPTDQPDDGFDSPGGPGDPEAGGQEPGPDREAEKKQPDEEEKPADLPPDESEDRAGEVAPPSVKKKRDPELVKKALEKAVKVAFEGVDYKRLEKEFHHFIKRGL